MPGDLLSTVFILVDGDNSEIVKSASLALDGLERHRVSS